MNSPLFGITLSIASYLIFIKIQKKTKINLLNPLLLSGLFIILLLSIFNIDYEAYNEGGKVITMLITPATVSLALPLYKNLELIKKNMKLVLMSVLFGIIIHAIVIMILTLIIKPNIDIVKSLIPKSITTAIAIDLTDSLGGIKEITVASVLITGIIGAAISPLINKVLKVDNDKSIGLALGASAHAVGTAKAASTNVVQGSFSSIALILTGLFTVVLAPIILSVILLLV